MYPKPLPMETFNAEWEKCNQFEQWKHWKHANETAMVKLSKQKQWTGVGILGKPEQVLVDDPKCQSDTLKASIKAGEALALACLSSEYRVLQVAGIDRGSWHKYTGRAQYPKFKVKPLIQNTRAQKITY